MGFSDDGASIADAPPLDGSWNGSPSSACRSSSTPRMPELAGDGVMREGPVALGWDWPAGRPRRRSTVVERDIAIAEETGARLHLTHLSTAAGLDAVRSARARGVAVTCDVTPHHLAMTDAWVAGLAALRVGGARRPSGAAPTTARAGSTRRSPRARMRSRCWRASPTAPSTRSRPTTRRIPPSASSCPFEEAAPGLIGLETALSLGLAAVEAGRLDLAALVAALSTRPASIIGEERGRSTSGRRADLVALRSRRALARGGGGAGIGLVEHPAARDGAARRRAPDGCRRARDVSVLRAPASAASDMGRCGAPPPVHDRRGMACRFATTRISTRTKGRDSAASSPRRSSSPSSCCSSRSASSRSAGRCGCSSRCSSSP